MRTTKGKKEFVVVGDVFDKQGYGFAMPQGSPLREKINKSLLKFMRTDGYWDMHRKWFGE